MAIVGGLFADRDDYQTALEALSEQGFHDFTVLGPEELFREPETSDEMEDDMVVQTNTAAGTVSGISANPEPHIIEDPTAITLVDELVGMGIERDEADIYAAGIQQNQILVLVQVTPGREDVATTILEEQGATISQP